jgi:inner membrane transporter RhtA
LRPRATAIVFLVISMLSIQIGASIAKQLFAWVGPSGTAALRTTLAATLLVLVWKPWRHGLSGRALSAIVPYGISLGCMNLLFYLALARIPLGIAVTLEFMGPLTVSLLASRRMLDFLWALLAIAGIGLILPLEHTARAVDLGGVGFALGAGTCWALYIVFGQRAGSAGHGGQATALGMSVAALVVFPWGIGSVVGHASQPRLWLLALAIALFSGALPYSLEMVALKRLPARTFGILMSLEPVVAAMVGLGVLHERLSVMQWVATGCIIIASAGSAASVRAEPVPPPDSPA